MSDLRGATDAVVFWAALKDAVNHRYEQARAAVEAEMRTAGSEKQRARDLDGAKSGVVTLGEGKYVGEVIDAKALIEWCRANYPEQLQTMETTMVRPAYVQVLIEAAAANADDIDGPGPVAVDPNTGAVVPGVKARWAEGAVRVQAEHAAKRRAANLLLNALEGDGPEGALSLVYGEGRQELEEGSP